MPAGEPPGFTCGFLWNLNQKQSVPMRRSRAPAAPGDETVMNNLIPLPKMRVINLV